MLFWFLSRVVGFFMSGYRCEPGWKTKAEQGLEHRTRAYKCNNNVSACEIKRPPTAVRVKLWCLVVFFFWFFFTFKAWFYTFPLCVFVCVRVWRSELCSLICSASPCRCAWMLRSRWDVRDTDSQHLLFFFFFPVKRNAGVSVLIWHCAGFYPPLSTRRVKDKANAG